MLTSCAVENTPASPLTPPMRRAVGSCTVPRTGQPKSGFLLGSALLSSSIAVGATRGNRLVLQVPAGQATSSRPLGAGAHAIAAPLRVWGPHALVGGREGGSSMPSGAKTSC